MLHAGDVSWYALRHVSDARPSYSALAEPFAPRRVSLFEVGVARRQGWVRAPAQNC